jgi:hypothetical protein
LSTPFLAALLFTLFMECLRGGSVFSLGHSATKAFPRSRRKLSIPRGRECAQDLHFESDDRRPNAC